MLYRYEKHIGLAPYTHSSHMALTQLMENHSTLMTTLFFPRAPQLQALPHPPEHHQETLHNVPPVMFCKSWPFSFLGFFREFFPTGFFTSADSSTVMVILCKGVWVHPFNSIVSAEWVYQGGKPDSSVNLHVDVSPWV